MDFTEEREFAAYDKPVIKFEVRRYPRMKLEESAVSQKKDVLN